MECTGQAVAGFLAVDDELLLDSLVAVGGEVGKGQLPLHGFVAVIGEGGKGQLPLHGFVAVIGEGGKGQLPLHGFVAAGEEGGKVQVLHISAADAVKGVGGPGLWRGKVTSSDGSSQWIV